MFRVVAPSIPVLALCLLASAPAQAGGGPPRGGGGPPQLPPALVRVLPVEARPVAAGRTFVGSIEPVRRSLVGSEFAGLVVAFLVREGDRVEEGQPLVRLSTEILDLRIEAAQSTLEEGRQRLAELESGSRPQEIDQARARVDQLGADLELRRWKLEASQRLYEQNTISEDELRDARLAVRASELLLDASKAALALVEAGPRDEEIAQARAVVERQDAEVRRLQEEKRKYEIGAPFGGYVVAEHTEVGQWLSVGAPVAEIVALDEVDVVVPVVEDFVGRVAVGQDARIQVDALANRVFTGKVAKVVPSADPRSRTFPVKVRLANERVGESVLLKAGMYVGATLGVGEERPAILVPKDAIVLGGPVPALIWLVDPETTTAKMVSVQLGIAVGELVEVIGPVPPDARVVVTGNERIFMPGQPLQIVE